MALIEHRKMMQAERKWVHKAAAQLLMCRAMKAWMQWKENLQHKRATVPAARRHFESTLMCKVLQAWQNRCVGAASSEHSCLAAQGLEAGSEQELPAANCEHADRCGGHNNRPRSAGARPKVGKRAHVVVGHVRQTVGCRQRHNQSVPRSSRSRVSRCVSTLRQETVVDLFCKYLCSMCHVCRSRNRRDSSSYCDSLSKWLQDNVT
jgi:hypothetical protein